jgi:hypothetical protein
MYGKKGNLCPSFGLKRSAETKQKLSFSKIGKNNPNAGIYEIFTPDNKHFIIDYSAAQFVKNYPEYNITRGFIYIASYYGKSYKGWIVKKLN